MRAAPAISLLLHDPLPAALFVVPLVSLASASLAAALAQHLEWKVAALALGVAAAAALGAFAARRSLRAPAAVLAWDGAAWSYATGTPAPLRDVEVAIDLGVWLLLRLRPAAGGSRWISVARPGLEESWHGLRCALEASRARRALPPGTVDP